MLSCGSVQEAIQGPPETHGAQVSSQDLRKEQLQSVREGDG